MSETRGFWGRGRGRRQAIFYAACLAVAAGAVSLLVAALVILNPPRTEPVAADVIVVMAGDTDQRHAVGAELARDGIAENLVVSNPAGVRDASGYRLCRGLTSPPDVETWCLDPRPATTTGEAQTFDELARERGWDTAVVITNRTHHYRALMNFSSCAEATPTVISVPDSDGRSAAGRVIWELGGFLKFFFRNPC